MDNEFENEIIYDEDAFLYSTGPLLSKTSVSIDGKYLGEFKTEELAVDAIKKYMHQNNFYPNVWYVSDHGNISIYNMEL